MRRSIIAAVTALTFAAVITGCGASDGSGEAASTSAAEAEGTSAEDTEAASEAEDDGSAADGENVVVKLGVVGSIYEDLWEGPAEKLKEEGIDLELVQFSDYVTPNNALNSGEIDLNSFQHQIYLNNEIATES